MKPKGYLADSTFFQVLTYEFEEGDPETALMNPNSLVCQRKLQRKYSGTNLR